MDRTATIESQFLPCIGFFSLCKSISRITIEAHEHYQKRSYRNRAHLLSSQGVQVLTVPLVKGKNQQTPIQDVRIAYNEDWVTKAIRLIQSCYSKSAYFQFYFEDISDILRRKPSYLWQLNLDFINYFSNKLNYPPITQSTCYLKDAEGDYRNWFRPLHSSGGQIEFIPYPQVFEDTHGFTPNLSIMDLLMNTGPESDYYIPTIDTKN